MEHAQNGTLSFQETLGSVGGFWDAHGAHIETLVIYAFGILLYGLVVNAFYQLISKRVMFAGKQEGGKTVVGGPGRGFLYLMLFPLVSFAFFLLISAALLFLGGGAAEKDAGVVFTLAMAIVLAVRVAAYFSEATSHDVAKMLPLGLLGVFLVNAELITDLGEAMGKMMEIFHQVELVAIYFAVVVLAEYVLRSIYMIVSAAKGPKARKAGV